MADTITKIQPSDLISDSMVKINRNFEIILNRDDVTESKLNQWVENIENQLADIRNDNGIISDTLLNNVQKLENKINNITNLDGITKEVQNIINNATTDVENLINDKAGEAISSRLGDYVKTSTLNKTLGEYVSSTAFDTYRSDSSKSSAQSSRIVANSKFLKLDNDGVECLVRISGEITEFKSVEDYFKSLSASEKAAILGDKTFSSDDKALEDPDVIAKLIEVCERTFKTVISEMSVISQTVGPGNVENTIISTVKNGKTGKDITASIFTKANEKGSLIALNADHINIEGEHALTVKSGGNIGVQSGGNINIENGGNFKIKTGGNISVQSGGNISVQSGGNFTINSKAKFQIESDNFNIGSDGRVTVKGAIEATSLTITSGSSAETTLKSFIEGVGTEKHWGDTTGPYADGWLTNAFSKTAISGGLALTGNIFAADSNGNVTAGMMGGNVENKNDIRFFAGGVTPENAPFRVYEDGNLIAKSGVFSGFLRMPFKTFDEGATFNKSDYTYTVSNCFNLNSAARNQSGPYQVTLKLPNSPDYSGAVLTIFDSPVKSKSSPELIITCESGAYIYHPSKKGTYGLDPANSISCPRGGIIQFVGVETYGYTNWFIITDMMPDAVVS